MKNTHRIVTVILVSLLLLQCQPDPYKQGRIIYEFHCENCHMEDGSGLKGLIPSLENTISDGLQPDQLVCLIRKGKAKNPQTGQEMPPNKMLNEVELTNLVNYLGHRFSSKNNVVKVSDVHNWLENCL